MLLFSEVMAGEIVGRVVSHGSRITGVDIYVIDGDGFLEISPWLFNAFREIMT